MQTKKSTTTTQKLKPTLIKEYTSQEIEKQIFALSMQHKNISKDEYPKRYFSLANKIKSLKVKLSQVKNFEFLAQ